MTSFWLSNTCRLLHCLKQYSGDEVSAKTSPAPKGHLRTTKVPPKPHFLGHSDVRPASGHLKSQLRRGLGVSWEAVLYPNMPPP